MKNDDRRDASLLIGLHKLAENSGDGMVPELYALLAAREEAEANNVIAFQVAPGPATFNIPEDETGKILAFRR
jgi:hypothetical protein